MRKRYGHRELTLTVLDVGQGSSALLELPRGPCILVDGGGFYDNRFDVGARVVGPFLWTKKIAVADDEEFKRGVEALGKKCCVLGAGDSVTV